MKGKKKSSRGEHTWPRLLRMIVDNYQCNPKAARFSKAILSVFSHFKLWSFTSRRNPIIRNY